MTTSLWDLMLVHIITAHPPSTENIDIYYLLISCRTEGHHEEGEQTMPG